MAGAPKRRSLDLQTYWQGLGRRPGQIGSNKVTAKNAVILAID